MSELHKFLFEGLPVRGMIVRLTDAWQEILARRASNTATGAYPTPVAELLGENVTVGHMVMLHGCTIGDNTLIGIGAVVLNNARIGRNCIVGAGSVVTEGKEFPDNSLIMGTPAKVVRTLDDEAAAKLRQGAENYVANARRFAKGLKKIA